MQEFNAGGSRLVSRPGRRVTRAVQDAGGRGEEENERFRYKMSLFSLYHICYVQRVCYGTDIYDGWRERYVLIM
jgi:hypothetical protein